MVSHSSEPAGLHSAQAGSRPGIPNSISNNHARNTSQTGNGKAEPAVSRESPHSSPTLDEVDAASQEECEFYDNPEDMVGVSIGHAQTHIRSPNTPAIEKEYSMEGFYDGSDALAPDSGGAREEEKEDKEKEKGGTPEQQEAAVQVGEESARHLLPGGAARPAAGRDTRKRLVQGPRDGRRTPAAEQQPESNNRADPSRKRSKTWAFPGKNYAPYFNLKKYLPHLSSMSLPKTPNLSLATSLHHGRVGGKTSGEEKAEKPDTTSTNMDTGTEPQQPTDKQHTVSRRRSAADRLMPDSQSVQQSGIDTSLATNQESQKRPTLRRSTSENSSLFTTRVLSRTSNPEWDDVSEHGNNRFQAIMDSFRDSTFRLVSLPSINLAALRREINFGPMNGPLAEEASRNIIRGTPEDTVEAKHRARRLRHHPHHPSSSSPKVIEWEDNTEKQFPHLSHAMKELKGDVVIMGGYRSSVLRSATPPHRQLWIPLKVGFNLRKVNLSVGLNPEDEENMEDHVIPSGTLSHIGLVDICRRLMRKLRKCDNSRNGELRVWDYGYDWRLSPHLLSRRLIEFLQDLPCNQPDIPPERRGAVIIAHSLGGLIVRHAVNQRPELFSGVVYAGTPQHCVNILGPLRNGDDVLFSSDVLSAQVNFSFRTSYTLLPLDGGCFVSKHTREQFPLDFFNVDTWKEYRLTPCLNPPLPPLSSNNSSNHRFSNILSSNKHSPSPSSFEQSPDRQARSQGQTDNKPTSDTHSRSSPSPSSPSSSSPSRSSVQDIGDKAANEAAAVSDTVQSAAHAAPRQGAVGPSLGRRRAQTTTETEDDTIRDDSAAPAAPSHDEAYNYLSRTLADTVKFKRELAFNPSHHKRNVYPPVAVLYGKGVPTVYGAKVSSRESIKHSDAFDELVFAAGDGVVLARAAMVPDGYKVVKDGLVQSERGHVGLMGDLEGVGKCLSAVARGRNEGIGLGLKEEGCETNQEESSF